MAVICQFQLYFCFIECISRFVNNTLISVCISFSTIKCGVRPLDSERRGIRSSPETFGYNDEINKWVQSEGKIVGGDTAAYGSVPWQGRIHRISIDRHHCGFVILNEFWLLSAAHCFL
jgi:hypothetical protein